MADMDAAVFGALPVLGADPAIAAEVSASSRALVPGSWWLRAERTTVRRRMFRPRRSISRARTPVAASRPTSCTTPTVEVSRLPGSGGWPAPRRSSVGSRARPGAQFLAPAPVRLFRPCTGLHHAEIEREREEVLVAPSPSARRPSALILDGAPVDRDDASRRLRHELARHHTALVLWAEPPGVPEGALESAAVALTPAPRCSETADAPGGHERDVGVGSAAMETSLQASCIRRLRTWTRISGLPRGGPAAGFAAFARAMRRR